MIEFEASWKANGEGAAAVGAPRDLTSPSCRRQAGGMLIVVNNGTHFLPELLASLVAIGAEYRLVGPSETLDPAETARISGAILTGGNAHVYRTEDLAGLRLDTTLLAELGSPVLGICLGHQLIVHHFGGSVEALPSPVDELTPLELIGGDSLFAGVTEPFVVRVAHDDVVTRLPDELQCLARSQFGEFEAIRHRTRPIYGLQFHPETSGAAGRAVLGNFLAQCLRVSERGAYTATGVSRPMSEKSVNSGR